MNTAKLAVINNLVALGRDSAMEKYRYDIIVTWMSVDMFSSTLLYPNECICKRL